MSETYTSISTSIQSSNHVSPTSNRFHTISSSTTSYQLPKPPNLIILSPWPNATPKHIERYIQGYKILYPTSRIVILQTHPNKQPQDHETTITSLLDDLKVMNPDSEHLLHLFGNSSAVTGCDLLHSYSAYFHKPLNLRTLILDTAPPVSTQLYEDVLSFRNTQPSQLPFVILSLLSHIFAIIYYIFCSTEDRNVEEVRKVLNDAEVVGKHTYLCYVLASGTLFSWKESQRREWSVDRGKVGKGGRWCGDEERYWMGVEDAWERRV